MEGKFDYFHKKTTHPHTNMSKASLNMLTRTSGKDLAKKNVYMTSVDTGWVSEMVPNHMLDDTRTVPLDEIDGAMRVLDPIIVGLNEHNLMHSVLLKDYKIVTW